MKLLGASATFFFWFVATVAHAGTSTSEKSLTLEPRLEHVRSTKSQAQRLFLKSSGNVKSESAQLYAEGYLEGDTAEIFPDQRRSRSTGVLQEIYFEYKMENFFFRLGKQSVRWSESWSIPSLDFWTSRHFERLFFDPLTEQLSHSTGLLASWVNESSNIDVFQVAFPSQNYYPEPFPTTSEVYKPQWGARAKHRFDFGLDVAIMTAFQQTTTTSGMNLSYATDLAVPKLEVGFTNNDDKFGSLGVDIFWGSFSFLPQATRYESSTLTLNQWNTLLYFPIKFSQEPHSIDVQAMYNSDTLDQFYSLAYSYTFESQLQISGFIQNYWGQEGTLFGVYKNMLNGNVVGIRLSSVYSL